MTAIFVQKQKWRSREISHALFQRDVIYRGFVVTLRVPTRENEMLGHLDLCELKLAGLPARHERIKYHLKWCEMHE